MKLGEGQHFSYHILTTADHLEPSRPVLGRQIWGVVSTNITGFYDCPEYKEGMHVDVCYGIIAIDQISLFATTRLSHNAHRPCSRTNEL